MFIFVFFSIEISKCYQYQDASNKTCFLVIIVLIGGKLKFSIHVYVCFYLIFL